MSIEDTDNLLEILARLSPAISQIDSIGFSTGDKFTSSDVAACLCGCDDIGLMGLFKRVDSDISHSEGFYRLYAKILGLGKGKGWKGRRTAIETGRLRKLLTICLDDYYVKHKCRVCRGTGKVPVPNSPLTRTCRSCKGERFKQRLDKERAEILSVTRSEYSKVWKSRHKSVMEYLQDTLPNREANARERIRRNLRQGTIKTFVTGCQADKELIRLLKLAISN